MCQAAGGDVTLLADAIGYDKRIGREFLNAGLGFGGGCLPKDIRALAVRAEELGVTVLTDFIHSVEAINDGQRMELADLTIDQAGGDVTGKRIAVLGAAFKPGTDDTRNSPALTVADHLHARGAEVRIYDPQARLPPREGFTQVASVEQAALGAEVVPPDRVAQFRYLNPEALGSLVKSKIIIDGRLKLHAPPGGTPAGRSSRSAAPQQSRPDAPRSSLCLDPLVHSRQALQAGQHGGLERLAAPGRREDGYGVAHRAILPGLSLTKGDSVQA
jgi:UDPglucose 6-dehydrogenase